MITSQITPQTRLILEIHQLYETTTNLDPNLFQEPERSKFLKLLKHFEKLNHQLSIKKILSLDIMILELNTIKMFFTEHLDGTMLIDIEFDETLEKILNYAKAIKALSIEAVA